MRNVQGDVHGSRGNEETKKVDRMWEEIATEQHVGTAGWSRKIK